MDGSSSPPRRKDAGLVQTEVACPRCERRLRIPAQAAGLRARCPACHQTFVVPRKTDLLEETVSGWLDRDVSPVIERRDRLERQLSESHGTRGRVEAPRQVEWGGEVTRPREVPGSTKAVRPEPAEGDKEETTDLPDADALRPELNRPWLAVVRVTEGGVEIAFDSEGLKDPAFQAAMPMRCALTGESDPASLRARPMVFADQARLSRRGIREMERAAEHHVVNHQAPRLLLAGMKPLKSLPAPFDRPVLWYVSGRAADRTLSCTTTTEGREEEGITCRVTVPDHETALQWVGRVDGVCSHVYRDLESRIGELRNDAWHQLPDTTRLRLDDWLDFRAGERFVAYINDADFDRDDPGWGGFALTNQRVVFHKYHRDIDIEFDDPAVLIVRMTEGGVAQLSLEGEKVCTRLGRIRTEDVSTLTSGLRDASRLRIELVGVR